jgi:hypothetical protein
LIVSAATIYYITTLIDVYRIVSSVLLIYDICRLGFLGVSETPWAPSGEFIDDLPIVEREEVGKSWRDTEVFVVMVADYWLKFV